MKLKPYKRTVLGELTYTMLLLVCLMWFITLSFIIYDCYADCELYSIDALCFYGNYPVFGSYAPNSKYFFAWWMCAVLWFVLWLAYKEQVWAGWCWH